MLEKLITIQEPKEKKAFYCSDYGKSGIDMFFSLKNTPKTNPPEWYDTLKWGAGKGVEMAMVQVLKDSGIIPKEYVQEEHGRINFTHNGLEIHGYIDASTAIYDWGIPIEIKSINNANKWDVQKYEMNNPRENYVGQLAIYMFARGLDKGHLFVSSIDGLNRFWFDCVKISDGVYKCGNTTVDLNKEFERWSKVALLVQENENPPMELINEYKYKFNVNELDWKTVSSTDISKARNGHKVIGDWQVQYSDWKNKIVELQGETIGYTPEELEIIKVKTQGYTTWVKK